MIDVVVVGGGNLAESLAVALARAEGVNFVQIYVRNAQRASELQRLVGVPVISDPAALAAADLYILAISDVAIAEVSAQLNFASGAAVVHTGGSSPLSAVDQSIEHRGVFYPMQTFSRGVEVDFSVIPIFLEATDDQTLRLLHVVANALSTKVFELSSEERKQLHLAAVFACNFANAMWSASSEVLARVGLPFDVMLPLLGQSLAKISDGREPRDVQTGPAVRGDLATQQAHCNELKQTQLEEIYKLISRYIWETSKKI